MLWPLLVEYTEPGVPLTSHVQQQGNMALFLTLFIVTCVEVLIVKVAQSERELETMLTPHDPPFSTEYGDGDAEDDEYEDICRVRASLYEEELRRQKRFLINNSYLAGTGTGAFLQTKKAENGLGSELNGSDFPGKIYEDSQGDGENAEEWNEHKTDLEASKKQDPNITTVKVREVIEKMIEAIIGGPLDGTTVGQMSTHSAYLDMFTKYHNLLCRELARLGFALHLSVVRKNGFEVDSVDLKQSNLKQLIKQIVSEAMALPNVKEVLCGQKTSKETENDDFKNKSYEDILATAILNKIIESFQNKNQNANETVGGCQKRHLKNRKIKTNEDEYKSDGDWSDTSRSDQLSLTIEEYIEEVTTALNGSEDERSDLSDFETTSNRRIPFPESGKTVVDAGTDDENSDLDEQNAATELITSTSSWEENWLFQKKRLRSTPNAHHPVPVPMLVPNPSEEFRALVGGVDADDLSDMSDCSESVLEDVITTDEPSTRLLNKEYEEKAHDYNGIEEMEENLPQSQAEGELLDDDKEEEISDARLSSLKNADTKNTLKIEKCGEQKTTENAAENSVSAVLPEVLSQKDRDSSVESIEDQFELIDSNLPLERAVEIFTKTTPDDAIICRTAEREKEKWKNPVPWTDNPYSLENIGNKGQRKKNEYFRIGTYTGESVDFPDDSSSSAVSKPENEKLRFSRDYYVNASKHPSGMSSPSLGQLSKEHEQKFENAQASLNFSEKQDKFAILEMQDNSDNKTTQCLNINKSQFSLPSVKELAKQFAIQDSKDLSYQNYNSRTKLESKHKTQYDTKEVFSEKEPEIDYSTTPVSEIIHNFRQAAEAPVRENPKNNIMYNLTQPSTRMEVFRKVDNNLIIEKYAENNQAPDKVEPVKFNGKQVHSLTARSISKEFREGLKNSSYQKIFPKIDRIGSGGESDQGDMICSKTKTSPAPSIDLKNMKKFWEEIIIANSNSTKQK